MTVSRLANMPAPLSNAQKDQIQQYLDDGHRPAAISALVGVTDWSVRKIRDNIATYGTHTRPKGGVKRGRPYKILPSAWDDIRTLVEQTPNIQLKEIQTFVSKQWGVRLSTAHISHTLKKMKISKRWLERVAAERAEERWERSREGHTIQDAAFPIASGTEPNQV